MGGWICLLCRTGMNSTEPQRQHMTAVEYSVLGFTLLYVAISFIAALKLNNDEFILYFVVMCVLMAAVGCIRQSGTTPSPPS